MSEPSTQRPPTRSERRRQAKVARPQPARAASDAGRSRLGDLTRPIAIDRRLTRRRRNTVILGVFTILVLGAFGASLFVLPIQTFRDQGTTLQTRQQQLAQLLEVNDQLQAEVDRLRTNSGIREAARAELGFFEAGEQTLTVIGSPALPTELPGGWPYGMYRSVIALKMGSPTP
jgi:cell division protein FtsB